MTSTAGLALLVVLCLTGASPPEPAGPTLSWEVTHPRHPNNRLYLTGSVHIGASTPHVAPSVDRAYETSDRLVVEVDPLAARARPDVQRLAASLSGLPRGKSLRQVVSKETYALLPPVLERLRVPVERVEQLRPWAVGMMLSSLELRRNGFDAIGGVDALFLARARANKPIGELETAESQVRLLAGMPPVVQDLSLRRTLLGLDRLSAQIAELTHAWNAGDAEAMERALLPMRSPEWRPLYRAMFEVRNASMARSIEKLFAGGPRCFVVVGAGHLVGEGGVPVLLRRRGFVVRRMAREEQPIRGAGENATPREGSRR